MSESKSTNFIFHSKDGQQLSLNNISVYAVDKTWQTLSDGDPKASQNSGIGNPSIQNPVFGGSLNCLVTLQIDSVLVNNVPYASDGASLLFNVNGSNIHVCIHKDGGMKSVGVYGQDSKAVSWDADFDDVGKTTNFVCKKR